MYNVPVDKPYRVTQDFGLNPRVYAPLGYPKGHPGIDYAGAKPGDLQNVYASSKGVVAQSGYLGGRGNYIVIRHNDGMETIYAHLSRRDVKVGQQVSDMQLIGVTGSTGNSTGVHLHFGIRRNKQDSRYNKNNGYGGWLNPNDYLLQGSKSEDELIKEIVSLNSQLYDQTSDPEIRSVTNVENIILRTKI